MLTQLRRGAIFCIICLVLFGLVFPLLGVGLSQLFFKHQADGSITANGSTLIGQNWSQTKCPGHLPGSCVFQGRPDALGPYSDANSKTPNPAGHPGDDPLVANGVAGESGATNLGPRSQELARLHQDPHRLLARPGRAARPPTWSPPRAAGSTPTSRPQDAQAEIPMVSRATGLSAATLQHLISQQTNGMQLGFLGSPYVNVLQLNEALAKLKT